MRTAKPESKKSAFFLRLRELASMHPYISFERIKAVAQQDKIVESVPTLKDYLAEAVERGILYDAGRGWYSSISQPARMNWDAGNPLPEVIRERFPLLPHFVWSTQQVNPWMQHLLGRFVNFVYVDADAVEDMCEYLEMYSWTVTLNPTKKTGQNFYPQKKNVVVRGLRREIDSENEPTPEGILVDLYMENERLGIMDRAEYKKMATNLCSSSRINMARLLKLLSDHKRSAEEILGKETTDYLGIF